MLLCNNHYFVAVVQYIDWDSQLCQINNWRFPDRSENITLTVLGVRFTSPWIWKLWCFPNHLKVVTSLFNLHPKPDSTHLKVFVISGPPNSCAVLKYPISGFLCFVDRASLYYLCNENKLDALFMVSLFSQSTSTCFGHICSPSSGGILYIYNNWYVLCFLVDCLLAGRPAVSQLRRSQHIPIVVYIKYTSWWWTTNMPETRRGRLTK